MKKLAVLMCALVLAFALPCAAFAITSASADKDTVTSVGKDEMDNKAELTFTAEGADWVKIENSDMAGWIDMSEIEGNVVGQASYKISAGDDVDYNNVTVSLVYVTNEDFSGMTCYVYVLHEADHSIEKYQLPVESDGSVKVPTMNKLSYVTFFVSTKAYPVSSDTNPVAATDTKATSPKTGIAG